MTLLNELQQATEGSRGLSDKVLLATGWNINYGNGKIFDLSDSEKDNGCWSPPGAVTEWIYGFKRPSPTENLQDAMGLVGDGLAIKLLWLPKAHYPGRAWVFDGSAIPSTEGQGKPYLGHTLPLALCTALKAREKE